MSQPNPFAHTISALNVGGQEFKFFDLNKLGDARLGAHLACNE